MKLNIGNKVKFEYDFSKDAPKYQELMRFALKDALVKFI